MSVNLIMLSSAFRSLGSGRKRLTKHRIDLLVIDLSDFVSSVDETSLTIAQRVRISMIRTGIKSEKLEDLRCLPRYRYSSTLEGFSRVNL